MNSNTAAKANALQNVIVKNNQLYRVSAKAIVFQCVKDSYWLGNYVDDAANAAQQGGTTASFLFRTENMHISNNIFVNTPDTQSSDQSASTARARMKKPIIQGTISATITVGLGISDDQR